MTPLLVTMRRAADIVGASDDGTLTVLERTILENFNKRKNLKMEVILKDSIVN